MKKFEHLKIMITSLESDAGRFYSAQNTAAARRLTEAMQDLKALAQEIRTEVQEVKRKRNNLLQ